MKSERGFVHLLIAGEIVLLILVIVFGLAKKAKGPDESKDYAVNTENSIVNEIPTEAETEVETETEYQGLTFSADVEAMLDGMTLEQQVAQLFIVSPETLTGVDRATVAGNGTRTALTDYPVGGVMYVRNNYTGRTQMQRLIKGTQDMSFEQNGQYLFVVTPAEVDDAQVLAVAWNGDENAMTELVRVEGNTNRASMDELTTLSYIETAEALEAAMVSDELRCVAIETNGLNAVAVLSAGADMICVTNDFQTVYESVLSAVQTGTLTEIEIRDAAGRVLTQKVALSEQGIEE